MSFSLDIQDARIGVIGLGYVGLPLAVALGREFPTLGYDRNSARVAELGARRDSTGETDAAELASAKKLRYSADAAALKDCNVYIVAVPTPVTPHKMPDLSPLVSASETIGAALMRGELVIY
jgi:UDP-N-acetyl-D-galactosamine dehydrogenase